MSDTKVPPPARKPVCGAYRAGAPEPIAPGSNVTRRPCAHCGWDERAHVTPATANNAAMDHSADFCCPVCGAGEWRTVNACDPVEEWEGACANCRFRWLRKDDALYFKPSREQERIAWARLVKATEERWREDIQGAAQCDYQRELDAAKQALRDCGVDVDALLKEPS